MASADRRVWRRRAQRAAYWIMVVALAFVLTFLALRLVEKRDEGALTGAYELLDGTSLANTTMRFAAL